ncbi:MAG: hypothetical protein ABSG75_18470 [Syntrophales bacterium]
MPSIILKDCPKVYILETHRSKTPDSTLQFIQSIRELISMIDFREASDLDRIGIPVFICHRIRPDSSRKWIPAWTDWTPTGASLRFIRNRRQLS